MQTIKNQIAQKQALINIAQDEINKLREECPHEKTFEGNYSYRIGSTEPAIICEECGKMIRRKYPPDNHNPHY